MDESANAYQATRFLRLLLWTAGLDNDDLDPEASAQLVHASAQAKQSKR